MSERFAVKKWAALACLLGALTQAPAQEDAEFTPPPKRPGVQITFIPPPLTGTLSMGIYSKAGKLVRTLHREARTKEFVVGLNGLITWWDGKTDAGGVAPSGNYSVRGFAVGAVEFQGEAFHFNDWIVDEKSPRIRRIHSITPWFGGFTSVIQIIVTLADGRKGSVDISTKGEASVFSPSDPSGVVKKKGEPGTTEGDVEIVWNFSDQSYGLQTGKLVTRGAEGWKSVAISPVENVIHCVPILDGRDGVGWWLIDKANTGTEVKCFAPDGTFVRSLAIPKGEPQPFALSAGANDDFIILLEESAGIQRVRNLSRQSSSTTPDANKDEPAVSEWAVTMSKTIRASDKLEEVQADLKNEAGEAFAGVEKITVRLLPNQLVQNKITSVDVGVAVDAKGSFLRTADGLPLKRITETPGLKWVAMMKESGGKGMTIFQSDGAVVEEFKAKKLASMMAFDAGDYEWAGK